MNNLFILLGLLMAPLGVFAVVGIDLSSRVYTSSFQCFVNYGYTFTVVRVYKQSGTVDSNSAPTITDAWAGGMSHVDGYIFPCYSCGNPAGQMDSTISYLHSNSIRVLKQNETREGLAAMYGKANVGATVGMLWIDIEGDSWSSTTSNNVNFVTSMVNEGVNKGYNIGIYSSKYYWGIIMGTSTAFSKYPLWYAHYDSEYNFDDYTPFGGWTSPNAKQYIGDQYFCSANVDKNYYP